MNITVLLHTSLVLGLCLPLCSRQHLDRVNDFGSGALAQKLQECSITYKPAYVTL